MALPITSTPVLKGKEAALFLAKIREEENTLVSLVATPKLKSVRQAVLNARAEKK